MSERLAKLHDMVVAAQVAAIGAETAIDSESAFIFARGERPGVSPWKKDTRAVEALDKAAEALALAIESLGSAVQHMRDARHVAEGLPTINISADGEGALWIANKAATGLVPVKVASDGGD